MLRPYSYHVTLVLVIFQWVSPRRGEAWLHGRNMDAEKQGRIERFRARIAEANPAGISSRLQHRVEIGERLIELDSFKLLSDGGYFFQ